MKIVEKKHSSYKHPYPKLKYSLSLAKQLCDMAYENWLIMDNGYPKPFPLRYFIFCQKHRMSFKDIHNGDKYRNALEEYLYKSIHLRKTLTPLLKQYINNCVTIGELNFKNLVEKWG